MKKLALTLTVILASVALTFGQKLAFVDSEYILQNIPEYSDAQQELDDMSIKWQREVEEKFQEIDQMYKQYQADAVLLPEDMKAQREEEIIQKEKEVKSLQKKRFGKDGDLYKKRQELIKPIQEKIYNAIDEIANNGNYVAIFDKSTSNVSILWSNAKYDISDEVLDLMGYTYSSED